MQWIAEIISPKPLRFVIKQDSKAGFYIYVYEQNRVVADYLQDTLEIAQEFSLEKFKVPLSAWNKIK